MAIDTSGRWWTGTEPGDIGLYLKEYTADGYPIQEFRLATCPCGSQAFFVDADDTEGAAKRTCAGCSREHLICDSTEFWAEAEPERCACPCGGETMNIGVGFALYPDNGEVKWLYVGCRCLECGVLGCYVEWKVAYSPSRQLIDQV